MTQMQQELLARADAWLAAHKDELIAEIQGLVRIPSVSRADLAQPGAPFGPDCRRVLDYALERGRFYGFETACHDGYAGSITLGDPDNALGVVAHLDVVPEGTGWVYPPYEAVYLPEQDALVGRGVDDNKAPAAAGLFVLRMLREFGIPMRHGVTLLCGTSEETGMHDMKALAARGFRFPKTSLVPDAGFPVNFAQKGGVDGWITAPCQGNLVAFDAGTVRNAIPSRAVCVVALPEDAVREALERLDAEETAMLTVTACDAGTEIAAAGRAGHAAFPQGGDNAIYRLTHALTAAGLLEGSCREAIAQVAALTEDSFGQSEGVAYRDEISGELTLVYGVAHLRDGVLRVSVDSRTPISLDGAQLEEALRADWARRGFAVEAYDFDPPFYIPKDDPRVQALQALYRDVTGGEEEPYTMGGGTYSRAVPNAISFGPSMPGKKYDWSAILPQGHGGAHGPDETLPMEKVLDCARIYLLALVALDAAVE